MASLQDKKIKDTYQGLIKTEDNEGLIQTPKELTDGEGNLSGVHIGTEGNLKVDNQLEAGSIKTATNSVEVSKLVDQADGIDANNNDTSIPTTAAVKDYVDNNVTAQDLDITGDAGSGAVDLDSESLSVVGANGVSTTVSGQSITIDASSLDNRLTTAEIEINTNEANIASNAVDISDEETARIAADNTLQNNIDAETSARQAEDVNLQNQINSNDSELTALTSRITVNEADIDNNTANITSNDVDIANLQDDKVPYTGATADVNLGEHQLSTGQVTFDQTPTGVAGVGVVRWNDTDGTLDVGLKGGAVTLQVGQEQVVRCVNGAGVDLLESQYAAVKVIGAQGSRLQIDLAQADSDLNSATTLGIVTETISNNQEGFVTTSGVVKEIDTTGVLQGETWNDGDVLYLSPTNPGQITNVKPITPAHLIVVGYVEYAHQNHGKIFVKVDNGYEIEELHNVKIDNLQNEDALVYDATGGYWKNDGSVYQKITTLETDVSTNVDDLNAEIAARISGDNALQSQIDGNDTDIANLTSDLATETSNRTSADATLQSNIDAEETARTSGDASLQSQIDTNDTDISNLQSNKQNVSEKSQANGYASLDSNGTVPVSELPEAVTGSLSFQGVWDASTNTPTLPDPTTVKGDYYKVSVEGTYLGEVFHIGDWALSDGVSWEHIHTQETVSDVFGREGSIVAIEADYSSFYPLISDLTAETNARISADTDLANDISSEATTRANNDLILQQNIDAEETARIAADSNLQSQVSTNEGDINNLGLTKQDNLTAGTGISLDGNTVTNTAPDQVVGLTAGTNVSITGSYPNFTINAQGGTAPVDSVNGQTGVVVLDSDDVAEGSVNLYDKTVTISGAGATTVTGTYPNFNVESVDTTYTAGNAISIASGVITNTAPDKAVTITSSGSATVTGTYPNFNVDATDTNTTYTAGTGISLDGTTINNTITNNNQLTNGAGYITGYTESDTLDSVTSRGAVTTNTVQVGLLRSTGDVVAYYSSDERLKDNFKPLKGALGKVERMGGYEFDWNDKQDTYEAGEHSIGVKAQEVQAEYPELVKEREDGYLAVDYVKLTAVLLESVKELSAKVTELENKL